MPSAEKGPTPLPRPPEPAVIARGALPRLAVPQVAAAIADAPLVQWARLLAGIAEGKSLVEYRASRTIFMQGQPADCLLFVVQGKVRLAVGSKEGKEAIVATLGPGEFFGEGCLVGQSVRMSTATTVGGCTLIRVERQAMSAQLRDGQLAGVFINQLLARLVRYEADLADQMVNSSEKRLARMLLLLSHFGPKSVTESVAPGVSQEHLAQMVGTTRSRINFFMNKFRKLGYVTYTSKAGLSVHRSLRTFTLRD